MDRLRHAIEFCASLEGSLHQRPENWLHANRKAVRKYQAKRAGWIIEGSHTLEQWDDLKVRSDHRCAYCGQAKPLTRDHVVPISKGGTDYIGNIVPACRQCNSKKNNHYR